MDQLRVVGVAPSATVTVASALSPGSLLFPFSDSCFALLSSASSSHSLALPDRGPSCSSFRSAPPPSSFPPPSSSSSCSFLPFFLGSCFLSSSSPFGFFPSPLPGFPPLVSSSSSAPLSSSSFPLFTSSSSFGSFSLPSLASASSGVSTSAPLVSSFSSASSTSSFLDFAAYQASVLGLSIEYQSLACCISGLGVRIFFSPASAPHQPVYLSWFERVHSALSEADTRLASLLASGRSESTLLPPRSAQYTVKGSMRWVPRCLSTRPCWQCSNALFVLPSISVSLSVRLRFGGVCLAPFRNPSPMRCGSSRVTGVCQAPRVCSLSKCLAHQLPLLPPIRPLSVSSVESSTCLTSQRTFGG